MLPDPAKALLLPWTSGGGFRTRNGIEFTVPGNCWTVPPNFLRPAVIGAKPSIAGGAKRITLSGITLDSPLETRDEGNVLSRNF